MTIQDVYSTQDPDAITLWRGRREALDEWRDGVHREAAAIHPDAKPYGYGAGWGGREAVIGLVGPTTRSKLGRPSHILDPLPEGWRWAVSRNCYRPVQGRRGENARHYLKKWGVSPLMPARTVARFLNMPIDLRDGDHIYWVNGWLEEPTGTLWLTYGIRLDARTEWKTPDDPRVSRRSLRDWQAATAQRELERLAKDKAAASTSAEPAGLDEPEQLEASR